MRMLGTLEIPRYVRNFATVDGVIKLHVFRDDPEVGYESVAYITVVSNASLPYCKLLFSKSIVAPLKTVNFP